MANNRANAVEGEATRMSQRFTSAEGLYDPYSFEDVILYAEDPVANPSAVPITTITPTKSSTGVWYVDYTFTTAGIYYDKWQYVYVADDITRTVVQLTVINSTPSESARDWTLLSTWVAERNRVLERLSDVANQIQVTDGSLKFDYAKTQQSLQTYLRRIEMEISIRDVNSAGNSLFTAPPLRNGYDA